MLVASFNEDGGADDHEMRDREVQRSWLSLVRVISPTSRMTEKRGSCLPLNVQQRTAKSYWLIVLVLLQLVWLLFSWRLLCVFCFSQQFCVQPWLFYGLLF